MEKWQNFFLEKMGSNQPHESVSTWGVYCKDIPFKIFNKVKEPAKRSWKDEHGDDEYIPSTGMYLEAYTMKVEFGCKKTTSISDVRENVGLFLKYLRESGMMKMYSSYTRIGRQNVRLSEINDNAKWKSENGEEWLIFSATFKVNDPITDVNMSSSSSSE